MPDPTDRPLPAFERDSKLCRFIVERVYGSCGTDTATLSDLCAVVRALDEEGKAAVFRALAGCQVPDDAKLLPSYMVDVLSEKLNGLKETERKLAEIRAALCDANLARARLESELAELRAKHTGRRAPVQASRYELGANGYEDRSKPKRGNGGGSGTISWEEHELAWGAYAARYPGQSALRMAERAGFSWNELVEFLGHEPKTWTPGGAEQAQVDACRVARGEKTHEQLESELAEERAKVERLERELAEALRWSDDDQPIPEDDAIHEAHPVRSGAHAAYTEAMRMVGAKRSKGALVDLVTWLLVRAAQAAPATPSEGPGSAAVGALTYPYRAPSEGAKCEESDPIRVGPSHCPTCGRVIDIGECETCAPGAHERRVEQIRREQGSGRAPGGKGE